MLKVSNLQINYLPEPTGVCGPALVSWALESDRRGVRQKSYQMQILEGKQLVYDSGRVESARSVGVEVSVPWHSITRYALRVRVTDGMEDSPWAQTCLITGFQDPAEWQGQFVSAEPESDRDQSYGTLLRREFIPRKPVREAWLVASAHGLCHVLLNGRPVSRDEMVPGWTSYRKRLLYYTWEVTDLLCPGANALGVMLGAGWYKGMMGYKHTRNNYGTRTAFGGQLILRYADGTEEWIVTDPTWKGSRGPILFSEIYGGEIYDARQEQDGWAEPGFDDGGWWSTQTVERELGTLYPCTGCTVQVQEQFAPKAILTTPGGDRVIDFGQNMTGWCQVTVENARPGDMVELEFFEVLDAEGNVYTENLRGIHQITRYFCRGTGRETFRPRFSFQGFQYAKIIAFPGQATLSNFTACVVHSAMERTVEFHCSDARINQLQHNILWGMKGNFLDIPTDCPQRDERLGWTGDVLAFGPTACTLMNTDAFFRKWLGDLAADQTEEGAVTHVVPDLLTGHMEGDWLLNQSVQGGATGWADVSVTLPWTLYQMYGDTEVLRRQLPSMLAWEHFMEQHSIGCRFAYGAQFGDWLALDAQPGSYKGATPDEYVSAAFYCHITALLAKILRVLGRSEAGQYAAKAEALREDYRKIYFTADGCLTVQTQTAHVLALAFDLVPETFRKKTACRLRELVAQAGGHLTTGFLGTPPLLRALSDNGGLDTAYSLLLREDFPSWLYQVKAGATTVWEHWDGRRPDGTMWSADMNSFNHYAYGSVGQWLYDTVAGLRQQEAYPGWEHFLLRPQVGGSLTQAGLTFRSVRGRIVSRWQREDSLVTLTVEIPANTSAEVALPQATGILDGDGLCFLPADKGFSAHAESGRYCIRYTL